MKQPDSRRHFLRRTVISTVLVPMVSQVTLGALRSDDVPPAEIRRPEPIRPAPLSPELVRKFVLASHTDLDRVLALIDEEPKLVYASWDHGGGDWETGLGGASHVGRRDIAHELLSQGARKDIFAAAMLGETEVVKAMVNADPGMATQVGPHGYRVLYHVAISGDVPMAESVVAKLKNRRAYMNQALFAAVRDGHYDMTKWLLENGATRVNAANAIGERPLRTALRRGDTKIADLLRQYGATKDD